MSRPTVLLLALATLSATALAQTAYPAGPGNYTQAQSAPIQRSYSNYDAPQTYNQDNGYNGQVANNGNSSAQPAYDSGAAQSEEAQAYPPPVAYAPAPYPYYAYGYPYGYYGYPYAYGGVGIGFGYGGYYRGGYGYYRGGYGYGRGGYGYGRGGYAHGGYGGGGYRGGGGYGGGFHGGGGHGGGHR